MSARNISVSGMAWKGADDVQALQAIASQGATGVEVVPCALWGSWEAATSSASKSYRCMLDDMGMRVPSLQSILFGVPGARLFEGGHSGRSALRSQLLRAADLAQALGAPVIVLGAPSARRRGDMALEDAYRLAAPFFHEVGELCQQRGVCIGVENNAAAYGCDFLVTPSDVADFVAQVGSSGFCLHLDTGSVRMEGLDMETQVARWAPQACHFHASEPGLEALSVMDEGRQWTAPVGGVDHIGAAAGLKRAGDAYAGWVSIEMKDPRPGQPLLETLRQATARVCHIYGGLS
jgi:sugar phosphate isomerase/epimerase